MKAFIRPKSLLALALVCGTAVLLVAEPAWWVQRGVRDPNKPASDFSPLNQGQLKNLVRAARDELNQKLPGGAGTTINNLVTSWGSPTSGTKDFAAVNAGQLKAVGKLFYDRLIAQGRATGYPWTSGTGDDSDFAIVNLGQAKHVFAFELALDSDGDGLDDYVEAQLHTDANNRDSDGDGVPDGQEVAEGTDPLNASSNSASIISLRVSTPFPPLPGNAG